MRWVSVQGSANMYAFFCKYAAVLALALLIPQARSIAAAPSDDPYTFFFGPGIVYHFWPQPGHYVELLGVGESYSIDLDVNEYNKKSYNKYIIEKDMTPQVSILLSRHLYSADEFQMEIAASKLRPTIWNAVQSGGLSGNGCTAYKAVANSVWIGGGAIVVDASRLPSDTSVSSCIFAALDFIGGFPTPGGLFDIRYLQDIHVRSNVISSMYKCAEKYGNLKMQYKTGAVPRVEAYCFNLEMGD